MKIVIFTSNGIRHKFVANALTKIVEDALVVSESIPNDTFNSSLSNSMTAIEEHFLQRYNTEQKFFADNNFFTAKTLPILPKEVNLNYVYKVIKKFNPDLMIVFGASIIKEPLLNLKPNRFINLHLGLSPYYRGSGTNFWPFVNKELEFVGSTILHLDPGIDTGDIITHVLPNFELDDDAHTIGCKVIQESVLTLKKIIGLVRNNVELKRVKQWKVHEEKYYKMKDFNESILEIYKKNLSEGLIKNHLSNPKRLSKMISLE